MKVFEVKTEYCTDDSKEITTTLEYVTSEGDDLLAVVKYYIEHCEQYEKQLMGIREVLTIVNHINE